MRNEIASCSLAPSVLFGATKRGGMAECAKGAMGAPQPRRLPFRRSFQAFWGYTENKWFPYIPDLPLKRKPRPSHRGLMVVPAIGVPGHCPIR